MSNYCVVVSREEGYHTPFEVHDSLRLDTTGQTRGKKKKNVLAAEPDVWPLGTQEWLTPSELILVLSFTVKVPRLLLKATSGTRAS